MKRIELSLAVALVVAGGQVCADEAGVAPADPFAETGFAAARYGSDARYESDDFVRPLTRVGRDHAGGLQLGDAVYVGRRPGDLGGFGVKWRAGANELALTHKGVGWRVRF